MQIFRVKKPSCKILKTKNVFRLRCNTTILLSLHVWRHMHMTPKDMTPKEQAFKKGCCQLQTKVCARITGYAQEKVWLGKLTVPP